jgi:hypothetical protein
MAMMLKNKFALLGIGIGNWDGSSALSGHGPLLGPANTQLSASSFPSQKESSIHSFSQ